MLAISTREVLTQEGYLEEGRHGNWVGDKSVRRLWVTARTSTQTQGWQRAVWAQPGHPHKTQGWQRAVGAQPGHPHRHRGDRELCGAQPDIHTDTGVRTLSGHLVTRCPTDPGPTPQSHTSVLQSCPPFPGVETTCNRWFSCQRCKTEAQAMEQSLLAGAGGCEHPQELSQNPSDQGGLRTSLLQPLTPR